MKNSTKKGFAILDILIIVSLLGLAYLSYYTVTEGRINKVANTEKSFVVKRYIDALEQFKEENGIYPQYGRFSEEEKELLCLGYASVGERCMSDNWRYDDFLSLDLKTYYPELPKVVFPEVADGIAYGCDRLNIGDPCSSYVLEWFIDGNTSCDIAGIETVSGNLSVELKSKDLTFCRYVPSNV